jgi:hypothetical protein
VPGSISRPWKLTSGAAAPPGAGMLGVNAPGPKEAPSRVIVLAWVALVPQSQGDPTAPVTASVAANAAAAAKIRAGASADLQVFGVRDMCPQYDPPIRTQYMSAIRGGENTMIATKPVAAKAFGP